MIPMKSKKPPIEEEEEDLVARVAREERAIEDDPEPEPAAPVPLSSQDSDRLRRRLYRMTEEFQLLTTDQTQTAMQRRVELTRKMRAIQDILDLREELVEVTVPQSVTGEPFQIGPRTFHPGVHHCRASVARYLLWLIAENQRIEMNRLKSNGRTIDLGTIGSRARMAAISRDKGDDDWEGRGR
jgi:hypothetical protein